MHPVERVSAQTAQRDDFRYGQNRVGWQLVDFPINHFFLARDAASCLNARGLDEKGQNKNSGYGCPAVPKIAGRLSSRTHF
jgi:hypothetical protein